MAMTPRDRRALIIFGTVAVAALVAYFLLLKPGGGNEQPSSASGPSVTKTTPAPAPSVTKTHRTPRRSRPPALPPVGGHDPFSPLVNVSAGGGTSPGTGSTAPAPSTGSTSPAPAPSGGGSSSPPPVSAPGNPGSTPSGGTATKVGGHTVILLDVFTRSGQQEAQISVDGDVSVVSEGQRFHGNFELVSVSGSCARILFGDQSFILCTNPQK